MVIPPYAQQTFLRADREPARLPADGEPAPVAAPPLREGPAPSGVPPFAAPPLAGRVAPFALLLALVGGCDDGKRAEAALPTTNATYTVDRLFERDGCTVYRFHDLSEYRYFVRCDGGSGRAEWDTHRYDAATKTTKTERYEVPTGVRP